MPPQRRQPPATPARAFLTPHASPLRRSIERRSAVLLVFLRRLPRAVPPLFVAGLVAGGLLGGPAVSALCLGVVFALFAWLLFLSWPAIPPGARWLRLLVLAVLAVGIGLRVSS